MLFSEKFGVTRGDQDTWFDPVLSIDTRLFIDPFLIYANEQGPFVGSHDDVIAFFGSAFQLLAQSRGDKQAPAYKKAVGNLAFPEVEEFCLGYTASGTRGSGSGGKIAKEISAALWEAIEAGIENLLHFELVAILREGIGADRISDITAALLRKRFVEYTTAVCRRHSHVPTRRVNYTRGWYDLAKQLWIPLAADLPYNTHSGKPVLLAPRIYLRTLPTINAEDFWEGYGADENDQLRANVNHDILTRVRKADIVKYAREHPDKLLQYARDKEQIGSDPYDFDHDEKGLVSWQAPTKSFCEQNPLPGAVRTADELLVFLEGLPLAFRRFVEEHGGWKAMWSGRRHRDEAAAQHLFFGLAVYYCDAKKIRRDVDQRIGRKSVLFTTEAGHSLSALFEVRLVRNGRFRAALGRAKPRYEAVAGQASAWLIAVELEDNDFDRATELRRLVAEFDSDARPKLLAVNTEYEGSGPATSGTPLTVVAGQGSSVQIGDRMGDEINIAGDVTGSAVGSGAALWARDITVFKNTVDNSTSLSPEVKQTLSRARDILEAEVIPSADKEDAADALGKLTEELQKPQRDPGRLKRLWENVKGIAPSAASALSSSVELAKIFGLGS